VGGDVKVLFLIVIAAMLVFMLLLLGVLALLARPWLRALASGAPVSLLSLVGMRMRGSPAILLIDTYIALRRAGVNASIVDVEGAYIDHRTRVRTRDDLVELVKNAVADKGSKR
jgi:uncharacterized protein YqfA (UPF0365 family)